MKIHDRLFNKDHSKCRACGRKLVHDEKRNCKYCPVCSPTSDIQAERQDAECQHKVEDQIGGNM